MFVTVRCIKEALCIHEDKNGRVTFDRGKGIEPSAVWLDFVKSPCCAYRLLKMRRVTFNTSIQHTCCARAAGVDCCQVEWVCSAVIG